MADQQNPIQNDNASSPINPESDNLSTDIDLSSTANTPVAPTTSDLGEVLVEKSMDATQQKAETVVTPETNLESVSFDSTPNAPVVAKNESFDPTNIDLGDISLSPNPSESSGSSDTSSDMPVISSGMFARVPEAQPEATQAPDMSSTNTEVIPTAEAPVSTDPISFDVPAAPVEAEQATLPEISPSVMDEIPAAPIVASESDEQLPTPEVPIVTPINDVSTEMPTIPEAPVEAPVSTELSVSDTVDPLENISSPINVNDPVSTESAPVNTETSPATDTPVEAPATDSLASELQMPVEQTDKMIDNLVANEAAKVDNLTATEQPTEQPSEQMTMDLDSLTSDLSQTNIPAENNSPTMPAEAIPAAASVVLPDANVVQPHKASKKKAFAMIAAFIALLLVGGFVFKTMMPEESKALFAMITGSTDEQPQIIQPSIETPIVTTGSVDTGSVATGTVDMTGDAVINTGTEMPTTGMDIEQPTINITIDQAKNTLGIMSQQSKKNLAQALKEKNEQASDMFYRIFKDSSNLLETLEKTSDISTIPDIETQISNLKQDLSQATLLLNNGNMNTQP